MFQLSTMTLLAPKCIEHPRWRPTSFSFRGRDWPSVANSFVYLYKGRGTGGGEQRPPQRMGPEQTGRGTTA